MIRAWGLLLPILLGSCQPAAEQAWPNRPITLIVPWKAGGGTDTATRALAAVLKDELGQPVNVVNRTGGGGIVGHLALHQARPDGYTLGAVTVEITMMHWTGLTPLTSDSYTPLALVTINPSAITVRSDAPWQSIDELVAAIRASPGTITASGTSRGGIWDLCRIGFLQAVGLNEAAMPWVPSQGAAPALQELLAGGVDVVTAALAETNALRQAGHVRVLAVMSEQRLPVAPEVPTLRELGIDYASAGGWMVLAAPERLPGPIREQLQSALRRALVKPAFRDPLLRAGFRLRQLTGTPLNIFLEEQDLENGLLMERAGLVSP
ncbi:MAG: tripartite tricarboxylate transporter substrate binding protein [Bacteroidota bacterium]|nr:tripartite tricarboxylate transporter substrate binding protein [Bacteroidota bacterium]MDE2955948.1 tripartite tricarboxylate transporter substrate binding protein [Bacteroidota bacterium]